MNVFAVATTIAELPTSLCFAWRSMTCSEVDRNQFADRSLSRKGVLIASFLALVGTAMTIYLILFLAQPPGASFANIAIGK
jgi:putative membrane protein